MPIPVESLVIVPAIAAMQKPKPISVALNERLLNTRGVRYKTPPAPIDAKTLQIVIRRNFEGNWFHH